MVRLMISHAADEELTAIWKYIGVEKGNVDAAIHILKSIRDTLRLLPRFPEMGRPCPEFKNYVPSLRCVNIEGYNVFYRFNDGRIDVGRIVHSRREHERIIRNWSAMSKNQPE